MDIFFFKLCILILIWLDVCFIYMRNIFINLFVGVWVVFELRVNIMMRKMEERRKVIKF